MTRQTTSWIVSLMLVGATLVGALVWIGRSADVPSAHTGPTETRPTETRPTWTGPAAAKVLPDRVSAPAADLLRGWDRRRADAYAEGDVRALRALYVPASRAGAADCRMLGRYRSRGLRVTGMRMQVLEVVTLAHAPGRWRLRVTDRLASAVAQGRGTRVELPRDQASTRVVTLRRSTAGAWRVVTVRAWPSS